MKKYTEQEINDLKKALYKAILKSIRSGKKPIAQEIVRDVLDANYTAQVDPDKVPADQKENIVNKSKSAKTQEKGVLKLKKFIKKKGQC
jgi:predicted YcjX-like family ATPase